MYRIYLPSTVLLCLILLIAVLPFPVMGSSSFTGGLDYFVTLRNSSLSHGMSLGPRQSFIEEELNLELEGGIEMSVSSEFSKIVIEWRDVNWGWAEGKEKDPLGIEIAKLAYKNIFNRINVPFVPKLKVDYGFSDADGNPIGNKDMIKVRQLEPVGLNPNGRTEVVIDWSKQEGAKEAKIKFNLKEAKRVLFKDLVAKIPMVAVRQAFTDSRGKYGSKYASVDGLVHTTVKLFKKADDAKDSETLYDSFPVQVHYFLEDDIRIYALPGYDRLFFGKLAVPSTDSYWIEMAPGQDHTAANFIVGYPHYRVTSRSGDGVRLEATDLVKTMGNFAVFRIVGAPFKIGTPRFSCGINAKDGAPTTFVGYLHKPEENYKNSIPVHIHKRHYKMLTRHDGISSSYMLLVGGRMLISKNVTSGAYRSDCSVDIKMG